MEHPELAWLPSDEPLGGALIDLKVEERGDLSVFRVADDKSNLDVIIAGMAANGTKVDNFDYLLLPEDAATGFPRENRPGETPSPLANAAHLDMTQLSATRTARLAVLMFQRAETRRVPRREVVRLIREGLEAAEIVADSVNAEILKEIEASKAS